MIEEFVNHGHQPRGAGRDLHVSSARQNGQTGVRDQPVLFDSLFGTHHIRVSSDHQRRRRDSTHGVAGNVFEIAHALDALVEEQLKVLRMGRCREIRVAQFFGHLPGLGVFEAGPECRVSAVVIEKARCNDQLVNQARMPDRHLQRDRASIAKSKNISSLDVKVFEKSRRIIGGPLETEGPVGNVRSVSKSLLFKGNYLPASSGISLPNEV
jgi:hypothetical protein